jgi:hypothetical protein
MTVASDLDKMSGLCSVGAKRTLAIMLALGPKPEDHSQSLLWEQRMTRLQGQLNSLSALVSKLTAAAVIQGLEAFSEQLATIGRVSKDAEDRIKEIRETSEILTKMAKVLDLGLALLAAAAAPSPATIAAVVIAGTAVADAI